MSVFCPLLTTIYISSVYLVGPRLAGWLLGGLRELPGGLDGSLVGFGGPSGGWMAPHWASGAPPGAGGSSVAWGLLSGLGIILFNVTSFCLHTLLMS